MKKSILTLLLALGFVCSNVGTTMAYENKKPPKQPQKMEKMTLEQHKALMEKRVEEFNKSLGLTEAQIQQAKEIRIKGHQQIKPLMEKKKAKIDEIKKVMNDENMKVKEQDAKVEKLKAEMKSIDQDIRQARKDNEKEFKSILTDEQKAKYEQIKQEGRKHYKQHKKPQDPKNFSHHMVH